MRKRPFTNKELFKEICNKVDLPEEILDYTIPAWETVEITSYDWCIWNSLNFGNCEGIYLDIGAEVSSPEHRIIRLGTFKTLQTSLSAMQEMGRLLADIVYVTNDFVNSNLDDFDWSGYEIRGIVDNCRLTTSSITYQTLAEAMNEISRALNKYDAVQLFDRPKHHYSYYTKDSEGDLQKYDDMKKCLDTLAERRPTDLFLGHDVPIALKNIVSAIIKEWNINGICSAMYIANVIANESGFGDGLSHFYIKGELDIKEPERIANRLQYAYYSTIPRSDIPKLIEILSHRVKE